MKKYYHIFVDGIDKTGKDTVCVYLDRLSGRSVIAKPRGILSQIAYSELFKRGYEYDLSFQDNVVNVLLEVDKEDWEVRCALSNEKKIDYDSHSHCFKKSFKYLQQKSNSITLCYNTSHMTPYEIAKDILEKVNILNGELYA